MHRVVGPAEEPPECDDGHGDQQHPHPDLARDPTRHDGMPGDPRIRHPSRGRLRHRLLVRQAMPIHRQREHVHRARQRLQGVPRRLTDAPGADEGKRRARRIDLGHEAAFDRADRLWRYRSGGNTAAGGVPEWATQSPADDGPRRRKPKPDCVDGGEDVRKTTAVFQAGMAIKRADRH